jgi:hypothetical protein
MSLSIAEQTTGIGRTRTVERALSSVVSEQRHLISVRTECLLMLTQACRRVIYGFQTPVLSRILTRTRNFQHIITPPL